MKEYVYNIVADNFDKSGSMFSDDLKTVSSRLIELADLKGAKELKIHIKLKNNVGNNSNT